MIMTTCSLSQTFPKNYFDGNWRGYGYGCDFQTPKPELLKGIQEEGKFKLIKTLGDNCVTTGTESLRGDLKDEYAVGRSIPVFFTTGNKWNPNKWKHSTRKDAVIKNINEFHAWGIRYERDPKIQSFAPPAPAPAPVVIAPAPAPVVIAPAPAPVVIAPAPAPVVISTKPYRLPTVIAPRPAPAQPLIYYYTNYFLGDWTVTGYICDAHTPQIEVVNIRYQNGQFYAYKKVGDNCVPAGKQSFYGVIPKTFWLGLNIPVKMVVGSPQKPASGLTNNTVTISGLNSFRIGNHVYHRVFGKNRIPKNKPYINMRPLVGKGNFAGPGIININPKASMREPVRRFVIVEEDASRPGNC